MSSRKAHSHTDVEIQWWAERYPMISLDEIIDILDATEKDYLEENNEAS
jgi:hypothetical protein